MSKSKEAAKDTTNDHGGGSSAPAGAKKPTSECGCGMDGEVGALKCEGGWYVLSVYNGCPKCFRTSGVMVEFIADDTFESLRLDRKLPDLTRAAHSVGGLFVSVVEWNKLKAAFMDGWDGKPMSEYDHPADFMHDNEHMIGKASRMTRPVE